MFEELGSQLERVGALILFHPNVQIPTDSNITPGTSPKPSLAAPTGHEQTRNRDDLTFGQMRSKNLLDEFFLGLSFDEKVQSNQEDGRPPMTFFSHNSAREYSSSHSWSGPDSSRRKVEARAGRSTTMTFSGSK